MPPSAENGNAFDRLLRALEERGKDVHGDADMRLLGQMLAEGLRRAVRRQKTGCSRHSGDENGPEVVDVREGGAGHQQIAAGREDGP